MPLAVILTVVGSVIVALATFTEALEKTAKILKCIPINMNWDEYNGKGKLKYVIEERNWKKIDVLKKRQSTGDHSCLKNCRDEPTRTNYQVSLSVNDYKSQELGERKLVNPMLSCISGLCEAYHETLRVYLTDGGKTANASFDVWSRPTTWELTAELREYQVVSEPSTEKDILITSSSPLQLSIPLGYSTATLAGSMEDMEAFSINIADKEETSIFDFHSTMERDGNTEFTYLVKDERCK